MCLLYFALSEMKFQILRSCYHFVRSYLTVFDPISWDIPLVIIVFWENHKNLVWGAHFPSFLFQPLGQTENKVLKFRCFLFPQNFVCVYIIITFLLLACYYVIYIIINGVVQKKKKKKLPRMYGLLINDPRITQFRTLAWPGLLAWVLVRTGFSFGSFR